MGLEPLVCDLVEEFSPFNLMVRFIVGESRDSLYIAVIGKLKRRVFGVPQVLSCSLFENIITAYFITGCT